MGSRVLGGGGQRHRRWITSQAKWPTLAPFVDLRCQDAKEESGLTLEEAKLKSPSHQHRPGSCALNVARTTEIGPTVHNAMPPPRRLALSVLSTLSDVGEISKEFWFGGGSAGRLLRSRPPCASGQKQGGCHHTPNHRGGRKVGGKVGEGGGLSKESYLQPDCLALRLLAESSASLAASSEKVVVYF